MGELLNIHILIFAPTQTLFYSFHPKAKKKNQIHLVYK